MKVPCDFAAHGSPYVFVNKQGIAHGEYMNKSLSEFGFDNIIRLTSASPTSVRPPSTAVLSARPVPASPASRPLTLLEPFQGSELRPSNYFNQIKKRSHGQAATMSGGIGSQEGPPGRLDTCSASLNNLAFLKVEGRSQLQKEIDETMKATEGNDYLLIRKDALKELDLAEALKIDSLSEL